uniref:Cadherin domain-containing protein n=1 Tax=Trichobilharzia regenti TaxID=157069 RepID=A0AA85KBG6_TRIRE|nr:unnamed protein product [Trichobilharzia regenti]
MYDIMCKYSLKYFTLLIYFSVFLNIHLTKSIQINEPNVFYVNDDTNEGHLKAVIVRANRPPAAYFKLNENTGDLYTRTVIDRESLCLKTFQNDERPNSMPRNLNIDFSDSNYQSGAFLSNSKIVNQCKFTFQVALHRQISQQQQQQQPQQYQSNDPGLHHLPEFIDIHVFVIDRNDHIPTFQPHSVINLSIPESVPIGTRVQLPLAYDPDSPEFSVQRYELYPLESTDFSLYIQTTDVIHDANLIQEITGLYLELKTTLDRETRESYALEVKAFDSPLSTSSSSPSTSASSPSSPTMNAFIPRLNDNRNVLKIFLTIEDINDNGPIFQPQNTSTQIDSHNDAIIRTNPSSSSLSSSSTPMHPIGIITYKVDIIESTWPKSSVLQLITKDLDSSKYSLTRYEFSSNVESIVKQLFKLNEHSGELFLKQPLDYEKRTSYSFDVLAIDSEYDRRSKMESSGSNLHLVSSRLQQNIFTSTANILVNVIDINDEVPIIEVDYLRVDETTGRPATFARIEENSDPPQFIADILVTDRDVNAANSHVICTLMNKANKYQSNHHHNNNNNHNSDNKTYSITNSFQLSEVRRQPGLVQYNVLTVRSLDREVNGAITRIKIQCSDSDLNDNSPVIHLIPQQTSGSNNNNGENIVFLRENAPIGTTVAHFNVTDQDSGENSRTSCTLLTMNDPVLLNLNDYFHVDPVLCNLMTRKPIDRESTYPPIDEIDLSIEVKDHGQPVRKSSISFKVKVINENDNVPVFQNTFYRFSVKENSPIGISIGQIVITDLDGDYARLDVRLQKQEQLPFKLWKSETSYGYISIDHSEAQVVVYYLNTTRILDREEKSSYEFEIYANDVSEEGLLGQHRLSVKSFSHTTSATILVTVEDENDNDPVIIFPQQPNKTFILSNSEKKYYQLMTVNANDKDPSSNSFTFMLETEEDLKSNDNSKSIETDDTDTKLLKSTELNTNRKYPLSNSFLEIDRSVGTVYLSRDIHQNDTGTHAFRVIVHDSIINPRTASLRFIVKIEPVPPRSHQMKLNSLVDNDHAERRILSGESSLNPEYSEHNYAFNNHYSKSSSSQDFLIHRKYDYMRTTFDNHSMPFGSSSPGVSSSSKQLTRRLTGDTVLILSLGLILLILLATLCLVIFARHWSSGSSSVPQNSNTSDKIRCSEIFCCNPTSSNSNGNKHQMTNNETLKKEVVNIFHSTSPTNLQDPQQINLNCDTLRSLDTFNASLNDSYSQKMLDSEHIYYRDCRQFSLLPVITSPVGGDNGSFPTDYTALRAVTSCKCCTPPPTGYTYNNTDIGNPHSLESFTNESLKSSKQQTNHIPNGSTVTYYTTLTPRPRSENTTDKRKVRIMTVKENMEMEPEKNFANDYSCNNLMRFCKNFKWSNFSAEPSEK